MIAVTVTRKDGTELDFDAVAAPWVYRSFLCINTGSERITYIPLDTVESFDAPASN